MAEFIYFNSRDEFLRIDFSKIVYFAADGNYTDIILSNKVKDTIGLSMANLQTYLTDNLKEKARCFVRIGKSYIINVNYIHRINVLRQQLVLTDYRQALYQLDISKEALKKLKDVLVASVNHSREQG